MKDRIILFFLVAISFLSCDHEITVDISPDGNQVTFLASIVGEGATKTAIHENGKNVWWTVGEQINVFYGRGYSGVFASTNTEAAAKVEFKGTFTNQSDSGESENTDVCYWAVYPYNRTNSCDGESVTIILPREQYAVAGSFHDKFFPAVAKSSGKEFSFYNVCGGACFSVSQEGITALIIKSNDDTPIAGKIKVGFGLDGKPVIRSVENGLSSICVYAPEGGFVCGQLYYAAMLPLTHAQGIKLGFSKNDGTGAIKTFNKSATVHRAVFGRLDNIDEDLTFSQGGGLQNDCWGTGTLEDPFCVAAAISIAQQTGSSATADRYYIRGQISEITEAFSEQYGNATFNMVDEGSEQVFQAYRVSYLYDRKWTDGEYSLKVGDKVIVYAQIINYKDKYPETSGGYIFSINGNMGSAYITEEPKEVTISEFLAADISQTQPYKLTGTISAIINGTYGNLNLTDDTGSVYVYGITTTNLGYGATNDKSFESLDLREGDQITIIGFRGFYNDQVQVVSPYLDKIESIGSDNNPALFLVENDGTSLITDGSDLLILSKNSSYGANADTLLICFGKTKESVLLITDSDGNPSMLYDKEKLFFYDKDDEGGQTVLLNYTNGGIINLGHAQNSVNQSDRKRAPRVRITKQVIERIHDILDDVSDCSDCVSRVVDVLSDFEEIYNNPNFRLVEIGVNSFNVVLDVAQMIVSGAETVVTGGMSIMGFIEAAAGYMEDVNDLIESIYPPEERKEAFEKYYVQEFGITLTALDANPIGSTNAILHGVISMKKNINLTAKFNVYCPAESKDYSVPISSVGAVSGRVSPLTPETTYFYYISASFSKHGITYYVSGSDSAIWFRTKPEDSDDFDYELVFGYWTTVWYTTPPNAKLLNMTLNRDYTMSQEYHYANRSENVTYSDGTFSLAGSSIIFNKENGDVQHWAIEELTSSSFIITAADGFSYYFVR